MIIGIDATRANKEQKTGVEWYSYHLIRELAAIAHGHTLRLYFNSPPEEGLTKLGAHVEYRVLHWPLPYLWTQARLSFEMIVNAPDILFIPAQIIPLIHPAGTVTTVHDVAYRPYPKSYRLRSRLYLELAARWAAKLPLIFTVSEFSKQEIIKYYAIPENRITVTYPGFAHESHAHAPMVSTAHGLRDPYIISIGRLERKKNTRFLVESFNRIKRESWGSNLQLALVGARGFGWKEIEDVIASSPYKEDIKVIGYVKEEEKHALLARARAFILISAYEGFGIPLLEAMDAEVPIIISDQASLPEVAGTAARMVPRGNADALRDALKDTLFNERMRETLIAQGRRRVSEFTWRKTAETTLAALEQLYQRSRERS